MKQCKLCALETIKMYLQAAGLKSGAGEGMFLLRTVGEILPPPSY